MRQLSSGADCRREVLVDRAITKSTWFLSRLSRWSNSEIDISTSSSHCPIAEDVAEAFVHYLQFSSLRIRQLYKTHRADVTDLLKYFGCDDLLQDIEKANKLVECVNCGGWYRELTNTETSCSFYPVRSNDIDTDNRRCTRCSLRRVSTCKCSPIQCPHVSFEETR